ncbi:MAG: hypothetical protein ABJG41_17100 [Cyclobacteriaceae bacterium]
MYNIITKTIDNQAIIVKNRLDHLEQLLSIWESTHPADMPPPVWMRNRIFRLKLYHEALKARVQKVKSESIERGFSHYVRRAAA